MGGDRCGLLCLDVPRAEAIRSKLDRISWLGIALSASSMVAMPYLATAKQRLADRLGSPATKGEGRQNMLCAYLAGALLAGLLGNALVGSWWLDPAVGLLIAAVAAKEASRRGAARAALASALLCRSTASRPPARTVAAAIDAL